MKNMNFKKIFCMYHKMLSEVEQIYIPTNTLEVSVHSTLCSTAYCFPL